MSASAPATAPPIAEVVRNEVERTIQRSIKGLEFLRSSDMPVGLTPKDVIHRRGTLELHHYRPLADEIYRVPLVMVMSLVSRSYIFDLAPGQSLIEFLLKKGYDVYSIDWGVPRPEDKRLRLEDYCLDFIPDCVRQIARDSGEPDVSMIGYCMGGMLALIYAALHADGPLKNLICAATPVNYEGMGLFRTWSDRRYFDVDKLVDTLGNVPGEFIYNSFQMLKPMQRIAGQIKLWDNMWNDEYVKSYRLIDRWGADQIPFPGECFRQTTKELSWDNKLYKNELILNGQRVDLRNVRVPCLTIMAQHDDIAPYEATRVLTEAIGSTDKQDLLLKGGHVSLMAGRNASGRLWPALDRWLAERSL
ncbi:MAG TPA: alpha/beta fold hydrolase [Candidatus Binataceae bacterium]|nr:alpha/beta fold hydrolase [Candidatus Binataceae bacterium]